MLPPYGDLFGVCESVQPLSIIVRYVGLRSRLQGAAAPHKYRQNAPCQRHYHSLSVFVHLQSTRQSGE